ncbi:serine/threonine protein kinase [Tundrisphaera lichenicola]|uniref:serine/threonine protein kinase n=1 Tax=Tundrisphaera lichenicola TaxID=2029860 RepID=UPI003EB8FE87
MLAKLKGLFGPGGRTSLDRRFSISCETPQGSMSRVYRAIDKESGRTVCLKIQLPEKHAAAEARAHRLERPPEGEVAMKVIHPNVVRTLEFGTTSIGEKFIVMEFIDGVSLKFVREATKVGIRAKVKLLAQAADALAAVHEAGFIHHDVNPNNFLVDRENLVKLIDFGLAVPNTPAFQRPGNRTGMLQYMAPELIRREPTDERIDIFGFGVMAFELLTDKLPFGGGSSLAQMTQKINVAPIDPAVANPRLSDDLCEILRKTLARKRDERWPKMSTLGDALREVSPKREA